MVLIEDRQSNNLECTFKTQMTVKCITKCNQYDISAPWQSFLHVGSRYNRKPEVNPILSYSKFKHKWLHHALSVRYKNL